MPADKAGEDLNRAIASCNRCKRLRQHCRDVSLGKVLPRKEFAGELSRYWQKPVPNFGSAPAPLLVVGLAPAAHGANRTGRMFTGDDSGRWLYRAMHRAGFAKTSGFERDGDNRLIDALITSVGHCAPPDNKPTPKEIENCRPFLVTTIQTTKPKVVLCLGSIAWDGTWKVLSELGLATAKGKVAFGHGVIAPLAENPLGLRVVVGSYHPSRQNTNTGRLTEPMLDAVFQSVRAQLQRP